MIEYQYGDVVEIEAWATDNTDWPLFGEEGKSYGFTYSPPFTFVDEAGDGDLIVKAGDGELMDVSPQFVRSAEPKLGLSHDPVEHPAHYTRLGAEVIDISGYLNFPRGSAVKYLARAGHKEGADELEDLKKAQFFIDWEIERIERERREGAE